MVSESEFLEIEERNTDSDFGNTSEADNDGNEANDDFGDTALLDAGTKKTDNVGEASVELDVETLVKEFEAEASTDVDKDGRIKRRLDAMVERKRRHEELVDFDDYDIES
jgi:hypothetical protein